MLINKGVEFGRLIGFCVECFVDFLVGIFGIMKVGVVYVFMDLKYFDEWVVYMVENFQVLVLIIQVYLLQKMVNVF